MRPPGVHVRRRPVTEAGPLAEAGLFIPLPPSSLDHDARLLEGPRRVDRHVGPHEGTDHGLSKEGVALPRAHGPEELRELRIRVLQDAVEAQGEAGVLNQGTDVVRPDLVSAHETAREIYQKLGRVADADRETQIIQRLRSKP